MIKAVANQNDVQMIAQGTPTTIIAELTCIAARCIHGIAEGDAEFQDDMKDMLVSGIPFALRKLDEADEAKVGEEVKSSAI